MPELSYRMLNIGSAPAGLLGLEELFTELYAQGVTPLDEKLADLLLAGVRQHNYVPKAAEKDYAGALRMEYTRYYRRKQQGKAVVARDYGTWRGYPREQIPWFPTISAELCNNCGACLEVCAREVYERDETAGSGWRSRFSAWWAAASARACANPKPSSCPVRNFSKITPRRM